MHSQEHQPNHRFQIPVPIGAVEFNPVDRSVEGFRYFGPDGFVPQSIAPAKTMNVCVITSIRDVGGDDCAGSFVNLDGKPHFMKGALHGLLDACKKELAGIVNVSRVIIDDVEGYPKDREKLDRGGRNYKLRPHGADSWIVPPEYVTADGHSIDSIVTNIPSSFRALPTSHPDRIAEKLRFERAVCEAALEAGADVLLSDHCMVRFEYLHKVYMPGKVVNIHPAITWIGDPKRMRGAFTTKDTLARAEQVDGYRRCGASFHFVSDELDAGQVICDGELTEIARGCTPEKLRFDNYQMSKIPTLVAGLRYLASNFEPLTSAVAAQYTSRNLDSSSNFARRESETDLTGNFSKSLRDLFGNGTIGIP